MMNKKLAIVLSINMVFTMFANVPFADPVKSATVMTAEEHKDVIGMFSALYQEERIDGVVPRTKEATMEERAALTKQVTRAQGAKMAVTAKGVQPATVKAGEVVFADVIAKDANDWIARYVKAAKEHGLMQGTGNNKFEPNKLMTVEQVAQIFVRLMGVTIPTTGTVSDDAKKASPWATYMYEEALKYKLVLASDNPKEAARRHHLVRAAYEASKFVKGKTQEDAKKAAELNPQVAKYEIIDAKTIKFTMTDDETTQVTLKEPLPLNVEKEVEFEYQNKKGKKFQIKHKVTNKSAVASTTPAKAVRAVTSDDLAKIKVEFDGQVNKQSAENVHNYKIKDNESTDMFESATLSADGKEVELLIKETQSKLQQSVEKTLKITNVKSTDDATLISREVSFRPLSQGIEIESVKSFGLRVLQVKFNKVVKKESAEDATKYRLNGQQVSGYVEFTYPNTAVIRLTEDLKDKQEYKLAVADVESYAGFRTFATVEKAFTCSNDMTPLEILSARTTDGKTVKVVFNQPIMKYSVSSASHNYSSRQGSVTKYGGNEITVTFDGDRDNLIHNGATLVLRDVKGIDGSPRTLEKSITVESDITPLKIDGFLLGLERKTGKSTVTIQFSAPVNEADAKERYKYSLRRKNSTGSLAEYGLTADGNPKNVPYVVQDAKNKVVLTFDKQLPIGQYELSINSIRKAVWTNSMPYSGVQNLNITDLSELKFKYVTHEDNYNDVKIRAKFSKPCEVGTVAGSIIDKSRYMFENSHSGTISMHQLGADIRTAGSDDEIVITIPRNKANEYKIAAETTQLRAWGIIDVNKVAYNVEPTKLRKSNNITINPTKFTIISDYKAKLELDSDVNHLYSGDLEINTKNGRATITNTEKGARSSDGNIEYTLTFERGTFTGTTSNVTVRTVAEPSTQNQQGHRLESNKNISVTDKIGPRMTVDKATYKLLANNEGIEVIIPFDEPIFLGRPGAMRLYVNESAVAFVESVVSTDSPDNQKLKITAKLDEKLKEKITSDLASDKGPNVRFTLINNDTEKSVTDRSGTAAVDNTAPEIRREQ